MAERQADGPKRLTYKQAAKLLGCYPTTVYTWVKHGCKVGGCVILLPTVDVGSRTYFTREGIAQFQAAVSKAKAAGRAAPVPPRETPSERQDRMDRDRERALADFDA